MQVRTFRAPTIKQALDQVKRELGPDAIILGNKQLTLAPDDVLFEVTAATEPEPAAPGASSAPLPKNGHMEDDIQEIKSFLSLLISSKDYSAQLRTHGPVAEIYHGILTKGFEEKQAFILLNRALSSLEGENPSKSQIMDAFCRQLLDKVRTTRPFQSLQNPNRSPNVFAFLGPTGVGKTTTLAKLAAYLKIKRHLDLGIISIDTYRIGAVDQLQTYANILDVPLLVAQNRNEYLHAREQFRHHDAILVDTSGKNFLNRQHVLDLGNTFGQSDCPQCFLVLSATAKDEDLRQTIQHFRSVNIHSLIFTKLDETMNHGSVINQLLRFQYPVSYFGVGQRVPEDIELATQKRLISLLFQGGR